MADKAVKSKAQLKAERRAKQTADREAKASGVKKGEKKPSESDKEKSSETGKPHTTKENQKKQEVANDVAVGVKNLKISPNNVILDGESHQAEGSSVHPAFLKLGLQSAHGDLQGSDELCIGLIDAFKQLIKSFQLPPDKAFGRELDVSIRPHISFLSGGKPLPPALGNLVRQLKARMTALPDDTTESKGKEILLEWLDDFHETKITLAMEAISMYTREKLRGCRTIITYLWSSLTEKILLDFCHNETQDFRVVVLDSLPQQKGQRLARKLVESGIDCSYSLVSSLSHTVRNCNLVLLNADSILANGDALVPVGTSLVAMAAASGNIPILVTCPSYKFQEKVFSTFHGMDTSGSQLYQEPLETIPSALITGIVTELRILPPTSAPAVIRVKQIVT